ncbi:hypothetical protein EMIHUDRAFT_234612 [Emiliania huxleyi CCMP1516]|uniref:Uncharacterized protein n=2 Tax=Emiliania huxleyi TaxID=2903 RepID=A0A0D3JZ42_EMIH1|nr:hypothetical protein EMIHUDRAFT_234612 [Emiliania huxleyi CCMP1516]EOD28777.1 hypothetical protein EMIHUDRAFT_234612 [Emiliania huxleyi CCMP1516]|eukprot:XP_005781206.1 hypothetical protein EMIHUDRAFT_234612 [Emiliania huxleyi CCMP1516]
MGKQQDRSSTPPADGPPPLGGHNGAHCSTEAPADTARRLGRGLMTSPATESDGGFCEDDGFY